MRISIVWTIGFMLPALWVQAQKTAGSNDTTLKGSHIVVEQLYKPQVKQAPKPEWIPQLPPTDTAHKKFTYSVPKQMLYYNFSSQPLRPLALTGDTTKIPFPNYLKVGAGNLSTIYLDAGIGSLNGKNFETAFHLHHISQSGTLSDQQSANSGLEGDLYKHNQFSEWHGGLNVERNQYYYYGYVPGTMGYTGDSLKQVYTLARLTVDMQNKPDSTTLWLYHPLVAASEYIAKNNTAETGFNIALPFTYKLDSELSFPVGFNALIDAYKSGSVSAGNNIGLVYAGVDVHQASGIYGHAMVSLAMGKGGDGYFLPDIMGAYELPGTNFAINLGWKASLTQNTYEELTNENPYLYTAYTPQQTRKDEVYGNLQVGIGNHITLTGRLSWWNYNDLATYINNYGDGRDFYVYYTDINAITFHAAIRYKIAEIMSVGGSCDFNNFYRNGAANAYAWGEPNTMIKGDLMIKPLAKLTVTAYCSFLEGIYEKDFNNNAVKMNVITDIGGNAEYQIVKRLSAFATLSNLLNDKYQRWYGYQAYGINIYGGIRLKF